MALTTAQIQQAYVAFFNRPADVAGLNYWSQYTGTLGDLYATFALQPEYADAFNGLTSMQQVNAVYNNLLGRDADLAGLEYWALQLDNGAITLANLTLAIIAGAQGSDIDTIANKVTAATAFTNALDTAEEALAYSGANANSAALEWLSSVTDAASLAAAIEPAALDASVVVVVSAGGLPGETFSLTTAQDEIVITGTQTNIVKGVVDGAFTPFNSTFTVGDSIDGNGNTIVQLAVAVAGGAAFATLRDIASVNVVAGVAGTINLNAGDWTNIGAVELSSGVDGLNVYVNSLEDGVDLSIGNSIAGTISADYQGGLYAELWNNGDGGASFIDGDVVFAAENGANAGAYFSAGAGDDVVVGDVTGTGGDSASLWFGASGSGDATVTVGDISLVVGDSASASVSISGSDGITTVGDISMVAGASGSLEVSLDQNGDGDVTFGDISQTVGSGSSAWASIDLDLDGDGNLTVGDISQTGGTSASVSIDIDTNGDGSITIGNVDQTVGDSGWAYISASNSGSGDIVIGNISQVGGDSASAEVYVDGSGNVTVGNISQSIGDGTQWASVSISGSGDVSVGNVEISAGDATTATTQWIWANFDNWGTGDLTVGKVDMAGGLNVWVGLEASHTGGSGDMTMGDIALDIGVSGTLYLYLNQSETATSVGNMSIGDITINMADDAIYSGAPMINHALYGATSTTQNLGSLSVGDVTIGIDADGTFEFEIRQSMSGTGGGNVGDVSVGDVSVTMGIGGNFFGSDLLNVYNNASGDIGNVSVGDISIVGDDGSYIDLSLSVSATNGAIGDVSIGNIDLTVGVSGSIDTASIDISGASIGDITIGNVTMTVGQYGEDDDGLYVDISASTGDIGDISIGRITSVIGISAYNSTDSIDIFAAGDIASFAFGGMSLDYAQGATGDGLYLTVSASGDIGDVTIGDVVVNMDVDTYISDLWSVDIAADNIGNVIVGDHTVNMADGTAANYASVTSYDTMTISATGNIGDVTFGDLTYNLGAFAYHEEGFYRSIDAGGMLGDVSVGNIDLNVATSAYFSSTNWFGIYGDDGIASVSFGDIAIDNLGAADTAAVSVDISAVSGDIGDVTFGDVSLNTTGSYSAWLDVSITASGDLGLVTIGDVSLSATTNGWGAWAEFDLNFGGTAAGVDLGNVSFNGVAVTAATYGLWFSLDAGTADVNVGGLTVMGTGLMGGDDYYFHVNGGDINIENIAVEVSATAAGLYDLSSLLLDVTAIGTLSLGTVDYSGYDLTALATVTGESIDVSTYVGEIAVIGTSRDDTITDNDESNTLTGGDGADVFSIIAGNNYATNDVIDTIMDFEVGVDKLEFDTWVGFGATAYYEGTYADMAAFIAGAEAQMTSLPEDNLIAGQVGSDVYLAIDLDNGDAVDQVVVLVGVSIASLNFADFQFV